MATLNYISIQKETEKAILVEFSNKTTWLPKSIANIISDSEIELPDWKVRDILPRTSRADAMYKNMAKELEAKGINWREKADGYKSEGGRYGIRYYRVAQDGRKIYAD